MLEALDDVHSALAQGQTTNVTFDQCHPTLYTTTSHPSALIHHAALLEIVNVCKLPKIVSPLLEIVNAWTFFN